MNEQPHHPGLWPVPGEGVLARQDDLILLSSLDDYNLADTLIDLLVKVATTGADGRQFCELVADALDVRAVSGGADSPSVVAFGPAGAGVAVTVTGGAWAEVRTAHGMQRVQGGQPGMLLRCVLRSPVLFVRAGLGADGNTQASTDRFSRLDGGTVRAGGLAWYPAGSGQVAGVAVNAGEGPAPVLDAGVGGPDEATAAAVPAAPFEAPGIGEQAPAGPDLASPAGPDAPGPDVPGPDVPGPDVPAGLDVAAGPDVPPWPDQPPVMPDQQPVMPERQPVTPGQPPDLAEPARPDPSLAGPDQTAFPAGQVAPAGLPGQAEGGLAVLGFPPAASAAGPPGADLWQPFDAVLLTAGAEADPAIDVEPRDPLPGAAEVLRDPTIVASGPIIQGVYCKNGHFDDPEARYCAVCGISMNQQTLVPRPGPRPPLGVLVMDDGSVFQLDQDYVLGREPTLDASVASGVARPLRIRDDNGIVSRVHARIHLDGWHVVLTDLGSANGTSLLLPGQPAEAALQPQVPVALTPGSQVDLGGRGFRYESHRGR